MLNTVAASRRFVQICRLAYHGIDQNRATFTDDDLTTLSMPKEISDIGLVQTVPSILGDGHLVYYSFLHLSIQELLAAIHISLKSPKDQISVFQNLFGKPRFSAVFQFYAGITKLTTTRWLLSKLPRFVCPVPASIFDLVRKIIKIECEKGYSEPIFLLLSLINCLYEAEDSSLCVFVAELLNHELDLSYTPLNPIDCLSVGHFASICISSNCKLVLHLTNCYIGNQGCKFLTRGLFKCTDSHAKLTLNVSSNNIDDNGIHYIAQVLKKNKSLLSEFTLSGNAIDNSSLNNLCETLSTNTSLKTLHLRNCSLTISDDNGAALYQLLSEHNSLEYLNLSDNTVASCQHIAAGLAVNKTLKLLRLAGCQLTDRSIEELSTGLIHNIEFLDILSNYSITEDGIKILARQLTTQCSKLNTLWVPDHLLSCTKTVFMETNKERKRNKLRVVRLYDRFHYCRDHARIRRN